MNELDDLRAQLAAAHASCAALRQTLEAVDSMIDWEDQCFPSAAARLHTRIVETLAQTPAAAGEQQARLELLVQRARELQRIYDARSYNDAHVEVADLWPYWEKFVAALEALEGVRGTPPAGRQT